MTMADLRQIERTRCSASGGAREACVTDIALYSLIREQQVYC